jgi:hypothetical protein
MQRSCYSIAKHRDRWLVSARGEKVLLCDSKKTAVRIVRQATDALRLDHDAAQHDGGAWCRVASDSQDEGELALQQQEAAG